MLHSSRFTVLSRESKPYSRVSRDAAAAHSISSSRLFDSSSMRSSLICVYTLPCAAAVRLGLLLLRWVNFLLDTRAKTYTLLHAFG